VEGLTCPFGDVTKGGKVIETFSAFGDNKRLPVGTAGKFFFGLSKFSFYSTKFSSFGPAPKKPTILR
jgi:hypothetical protein